MVQYSWTRNEQIIVLYYYLIKNAPGNKTDPLVKELSKLIPTHSPASIAMKIGNYVHINPISSSGLHHVSKMDREIWDLFASNPELLENKAQEILLDIVDSDREIIFNQEIEEKINSDDYFVPDTWTKQKVRVGQNVLRRIILERFQYRCCICGIDEPALLEVAHIRSWEEDPDNRLNPYNTLLLCRNDHILYDKKFFKITPPGIVDVNWSCIEDNRVYLKNYLSKIEQNIIIISPKTIKLLQ